MVSFASTTAACVNWSMTLKGAGVSSLIVSNHSSLHNFRFGHLLVPWSVTQDKRCRAIADIAHECPQVSMWWSDEMGELAGE